MNTLMKSPARFCGGGGMGRKRRNAFKPKTRKARPRSERMMIVATFIGPHSFLPGPVPDKKNRLMPVADHPRDLPGIANLAPDVNEFEISALSFWRTLLLFLLAAKPMFADLDGAEILDRHNLQRA